MKRFLATVQLDIRIQFRQGFYYASGFFIGLGVLVFSQLPRDGRLPFDLLVPGFLAVSLLATTFYYVGALVLLEKAENTLAGVVVTPLRSHEYLFAKATSLTLLAVLESTVYALMLRFYFRPLPFWLGAILLCGFCTQIGFVAIARYDAINEYMLPSIVYITTLMLPLLPFLGFGQSWLFYLHPIQPSLLLLGAAFRATPLSVGEWVYGVVGSLFWYGVALGLSNGRFHAFITRGHGAEA